MAHRIILVVLLLTIVSKTYSHDGYCCPEGQILLQRKSDPIHCWDPVVNITSQMRLGCNSSETISPNDGLDFYVNSLSQLVLQMPNLETEFEHDTFCIANSTGIKDKNLTRVHRVAVVCYEEEVRVINQDIYGYCMALSAVLLIITAAIYTALPELRDLQGKSIINFCLSLGIGLGILAALRLVSYVDMNLCAARGFFAYFFTIAAFFWSNAISIQILFTIRRPTVVNYGWREFIYYAIYAWGCPAILTIVMAILNFMPGDHLKPGIGLNHCWFFNQKQQWRYMYSVMSILIVLNIFIFLYTSIQLWRLSFASNHVKALKYKFTMTFRLFIIMGIAWSFEMIGSLVKTHVFWEILDIVNSLQGLLIFLVLVVFRRKVLKSMLKHGWLDCIAGPVERCLAVGEDEEDVVEHTVGYTLDERNFKQ